MKTERWQLIPLELLLYLEQRHGSSIDAIDTASALCAAAVDVVAGNMKPGAHADAVIDGLADFMRDQLRHRLVDPQPMSPREVLDAYQAEREGRPWKH